MLQTLVEQTLAGLGFELLELERSRGGTLRVTMDCPWTAGQEPRSVTVDDCELVTKQLQRVLEVESVAYARLEVSSPGVDRVLRDERDCERFVGQPIDVVLKAALGTQASAVGASPQRRKFSGVLARNGEAWQIFWHEAPKAKPGQRISAKRREAAPTHQLVFQWSEVAQARLAPQLDFKGRARALPAEHVPMTNAALGQAQSAG